MLKGNQLKFIPLIGFILIMVGMSFQVRASHLIGGEIFYRCLGNNEYQVNLKIYRDCFSRGAPFDDTAAVGIYDANKNLLRVLEMPVPNPSAVPLNLENPCVSFPPNLCIQVAEYSQIVRLPSRVGGYTLVYQRCCRSPNLININEPGDRGSTYTAFIPGPEVVVCNSMPSFNEDPPLAVCMGLPLQFDLSASDPDGDSLVYEFCRPLAGGGTDTSRAGANSFTGVRPNPPAPPDYFFVPWGNGYSRTNQIDGDPTLAIDLNTGLMTGTPNKLGKFLFAVCVSEYRSGQLLSVNRRDLQVEVVLCSLDVVADFVDQSDAEDETACSGLTINFTNKSINGHSFFWDFGDPTTTDDFSTQANPTYTYPDTGIYPVTLRVNQGDPCDDEKTEDFEFFYKVEADVFPVEDQCIEGNKFDFQGEGVYGVDAVFSWDFGGHSNQEGASTLSVDSVVFSTYGHFDATLLIAESHCSDEASVPFTVYPKIDAAFDLSRSDGCSPLDVTFKDTSLAWTQLEYEWNLGNGETSNMPNPSTVYIDEGYYDVQLKISADAGCVGEDSLLLPFAVTVHPKPAAGFRIDPPEASVFTPYFQFVNEAEGSLKCLYDFGDGHQAFGCDTVHEYLEDGTYRVFQIVTNQHGCKDTTFRDVTVLPEYVLFIPNAFTPNDDGKNEVFKPSFLGLEEYEFRIFNRWGRLIFYTEEKGEGWNGIPMGGTQRAQTGVYVYQIKGWDYVNERQIIATGHFTLLGGDQ